MTTGSIPAGSGGSSTPLAMEALTGSVPRTVLIGIASAAFVWGARLAIRRRRSRGTRSEAAGARPLEGDGTGGVRAHTNGSGATPIAFRIPVPAGRPARPVSHAELYAVELGAVGGALLAWVASLAVVEPLVGSLFGAAIGAVSVWRVRGLAATTVGAATIPWLCATVLGAAVGVVAFF